ncbi:MAG TPA: hypothetical protein VFC51_11980 [Chloroflexota bacterium]|nr:hypothetical protein [Chloroflexota bacterium]
MTQAETATLAIAVLSLMLAGLSLGWQAATFFLEGGRVKATFKPGLVGNGMVITLEAEKFSDDNMRAVMGRQGYGRPVAAIDVRSVGRLPVTIASWKIVTNPGGTALQPVGELIGPALPHRLEAGESQIWAVDYKAVQALVAATSSVVKLDTTTVRVSSTVGLGDGRTVRARGRI